MNITIEWLAENNACAEGQNWFLQQSEVELSKVIKALMKESHFDWANWTITKAMTHKQRIQYACYSAKQILHLFEKQFPKDKRPRQAIKAAMKYSQYPTAQNRLAAWSAAWSAAESAWSVAWSAAESSSSAADSARSAWSAAESTWSAAESAESAESAAASARSAAWKKILNYGLLICK